ncbi:SDR family NAD(P)-dependent oxidoreductase [Pseudomonas entomophila]|uniref:SDR family NAD(P)-dependent oxidoreductase n=1 Tax=Pseudomonas entomophila TaxID=312306 RepID=UPI0023D81B06|nr:SDR family NAD(P)-dependent oxidoreductase [Pseudomonas entomophila]MDF0730114.1 SDR family NAD(P)-dependent oxidoreductase [Pseudomonas entomophila]
MAVWLVTGTSRGLGQHLVRELLADGHQVAAISRGSASGGNNHPALLELVADLTVPAQVAAAVSATLERFGHIDTVLNNAGRGLLGAIEEASDAEAREVFELNLHGPLNVLRAVLPGFRARRAGNVVNISSLAGQSGAASWGLYSASKFALEGLSEALAKETAALGVKVLIVEPGILRTEFLEDQSLLTSQARIDDYEASAGTARRSLAGNRGQQPGDPRLAARRIIDQVVAGLPDNGLASRLILGSDAARVISAKLALLTEQVAASAPLAGSIDFERGPAA